MQTENAALNHEIKKTDPNAKLGWGERFAYGIGDYAGNLVYSLISAFLLVYYTEVCGMNPAAAGSIMAISRIFDGVSDLFMGRLVDKTHTKYGKARPWVFRSSIPLAICTVFLFSMPAGLGSGAQFAYAFISYNLVTTVFYTMSNVPYASLQGLMTTNSYERGVLGNIRMLLATFGTMTINTVVPKMTGAFGAENPQRGWTITAIILMIAYFALNLLTFLFTKERVVDETGTTAGKNQPSVGTALKALLKNRFWILIVIFLFAFYFMMSTFFGSNYYFAQYVIGDADSYSKLSNSLSISQLCIMFVTPVIMRKVSKRKIAISGTILATGGFLLTALAGTNVALVIVSNIIKGIGFGCLAATEWGMLQDAITYGQWLTGVQAVGMGNSASSFTLKIGSGLGTAALGWILAAGNFQTDPTGAASIAAINVSVIWIPIITCVIGLICLIFFRLDSKYDAAVKDLEQGKWKNGTF